MSGPLIVQSAQAAPSTSTTVVFTLGSAPSVGNILLAFCSYSQYSATRTIGTPTGWVKQDDNTGAGGDSDDSQAVFTRVVQSGDGTGYTFTVSGSSADNTSGVIYEISGASTSSPVNQSAFASDGGATTAPTGSVTPSVLSCLAVAGWSTDANSSETAITSGWTLDQSATGSYHTTYGAHRTALTSDTTTAISCTLTTNSSGAAISTIVLIAPSSGASVTGTPAALALAAPAGSVSAGAAVSGAVAQLTLAAPAGTVKAGATVSGVVAQLTFAAPAGSVSTGSAVSGQPASLTLAAPAGTVHAGVTVSGAVAQLTFAAPAGTVHAGVTVSGVTASLTLAAPAGAVTGGAGASGVPAALTLTAHAGSVTAGAVVSGATAALTFAAVPGSVSSGPVTVSLAGARTLIQAGSEAGFSTWVMSPQGCSANLNVNWYNSGGGLVGTNAGAVTLLPPMTPVFLSLPPAAARAGTATFQAELILPSATTGTQVYLDRPRVSPAGFQVPYEGENEGDLQVTEDIQYLYNDVAITRNVDQATYRTVNQSSRSQYYPRVYTRTIYSSVDDANAVVNCGNTLLSAFATPQLRVEQVIVDAAANPDAWEFVLSADIGDLVSFTRTPVGGATITGTFLVLSISLDFAPDKAEFKYVLCPVGVF